MIVCYMGGTCGDLICALFDSEPADMYNNRVILSSERQHLKKPHTFDNNEGKDQYLDNISKIYKSIPSHDIEYHIQRQHEFVGIVVEQLDTALWSSQRFKELHRPYVWKEMQRSCGAKSVEEYAQMMLDYSYMIKQCTSKIITLEEILNGQAVKKLQSMVKEQLNSNFYHQWLKVQHGTS
jgi:hypothetical protein